MMMMTTTTSMSWPQEAEVGRRQGAEQHKQRRQNDRPNISAAYDDNNDNHVNDDGNHHGEAHNQNNASRSSPSNLSTSALRQREAPPLPHPHPLPPRPHCSRWIVGLLVLATAVLTASATDPTTTLSYPSGPSINGSGTDYALLYGDSTTSLVPTQATGPLGMGTDAKASAGLEAELEDEEDAEHASEYIFDRLDVRIIFITLYTIVFCCCFFGE